MKLIHSRIQHGVGQGSFHSASVEAHVAGKSPYRYDYVYDCGGLVAVGKRSPELDACLKRFALERRVNCGKKGVLDLLVISHLDQDHINGGRYLANKYKVRRIVMPYLGPIELALVLLAQPEPLDTAAMRELIAVAHGGNSLWGVPVTQVRHGRRSEGGERVPREAPRETIEERSIDPLASDLSITVGSSGSWPAEMPDTDEAVVNSATDELWRLRFWNRGLDPALAAAILAALTALGVPVAGLHKGATPAQIESLIEWVLVRANRDRAVRDYAKEILKVWPHWASSASKLKADNLISIGLYSGPADQVEDCFLSRYWTQLPFASHWPSWWVNAAPGWMGTGDAPLGEVAVWSDFQHHYAYELPDTGTIVIPHHGAAPLGGPRFYNAGLNTTPGVVSVISFGTRNTYGHPRTSVVAGILAGRGILQLVTEHTPQGFHEVVTGWIHPKGSG